MLNMELASVKAQFQEFEKESGVFAKKSQNVKSIVFDFVKPKLGSEGIEGSIQTREGKDRRVRERKRSISKRKRESH